MQFHILSFEGPDAYARVGGLETRVTGLARALSELKHEAHLWFVGDSHLPGHETVGGLCLHRWCQWLNQHRPGGVYDGEREKSAEYARSLPPFLLHEQLLPTLAQDGRVTVMAEEWQTVNAVLRLDQLLREAGVRERVRMFWNANDTFGFEQVDWNRLRSAAIITTVSRYMKHRMWAFGVDPVVIANGLSADAFESPDRSAVVHIRRALKDRMIVTKMDRFSPEKRWLGSLEIIAELKRHGFYPLLLARGESEAHGAEIMAAASRAGLRVVDRAVQEDGLKGLVTALDNTADADIIHFRSFVDPESRRVLFRASDTVLADSSHEPFGLAALEAMAVGGIACTGCTGEDYAVSGLNALVLQTGEPEEFVDLYRRLLDTPGQISAMRRAARTAARQFAWPEVIRRDFLPRLELAGSPR